MAHSPFHETAFILQIIDKINSIQKWTKYNLELGCNEAYYQQNHIATHNSSTKSNQTLQFIIKKMFSMCIASLKFDLVQFHNVRCKS